MIGLHLYESLCGVELQVEVAGRREISNKNDGMLEAEVEKVR